MFLFALLVMPAVSLFLYGGLRRSPIFIRPAEYFLLQTAGVVCACIYCIIDVFFLVSDRLFQYAFVSRFFSPLFLETLLPIFILGLLYFLFFKDAFAYKFATFPLFLLGFYMVFLPVRILSYGSEYPFFIIFVKPLLFAIMLYDLMLVFRFFLFKLIEKKVKCALLTAFIAVLLICLPAFTEAVWLMKITLPFWLLPFVISVISIYFLPKILK